MDSIMTSVIVALITGGCSILGVVIASMSNNKTIENKLSTAQAVTDTKLDILTEEVRKHNNFAEKIPKMEQQIDNLNHEVRDIKQIINK